MGRVPGTAGKEMGGRCHGDRSWQKPVTLPHTLSYSWPPFLPSTDEVGCFCLLFCAFSVVSLARSASL